MANEKNMQIGGRWFITLMVTKAVQISLDIKYALRDAAVMSKFHYSTEKDYRLLIRTQKFNRQGNFKFE